MCSQVIQCKQVCRQAGCVCVCVWLVIDVAADAAMFSSFPGRLYSGELVRTHPPTLLCDWMGRKRERERERERA